MELGVLLIVCGLIVAFLVSYTIGVLLVIGGIALILLDAFRGRRRV